MNPVAYRSSQRRQLHWKRMRRFHGVPKRKHYCCHRRAWAKTEQRSAVRGRLTPGNNNTQTTRWRTGVCKHKRLCGIIDQLRAITTHRAIYHAAARRVKSAAQMKFEQSQNSNWAYAQHCPAVATAKTPRDSMGTPQYRRSCSFGRKVSSIIVAPPSMYKAVSHARRFGVILQQFQQRCAITIAGAGQAQQ